jgi:hypothetical protein
MRSIASRILVVLIAATALWTVVIACGGGLTLTLGPFRLSSRGPWRPLVIAAVAVLGHLWLFGAAAFRRELERLGQVPAIVVRLAPIVPVLLTLWLGLRWGTWVAGAADPYGYVSQSDLWATGQLQIDQPWTAPFTWPFAQMSFAPLGYRPGPSPLSIVPTYASGVPILMAAATLVAGPKGPFVVVPLLGALAVYLTYRMGRRLAGPMVGVLASFLLAMSPAFLFNLLMPMSDVAAAAAWTLAAYLALGDRRWSPWLSGLAASAAILIRPNVAPLLAVPGLILLLKRRPEGARASARWLGLATLVAGVLPGIGAVMWLNARLYGGPFESGYGSLLAQFELGRGAANLGRYAWWFWDTQPAVALLAMIALILPGAFGRERAQRFPSPVPPRVVLGAMIATALGCYAFYLTFDEWWYLRFVLPAFPALMILGAAGLVRLADLLPAAWRVSAITMVMTGALAAQSTVALDRGVWGLQPGNYRYISVAREVAQRVPENAMVISMQHSGSLRYYGHRLTLRWDWLPPEWLDRALVELQRNGFRPYVLLEDWEIPRFRERFGASLAGQLRSKPVAEPGPRCTLFDPLAPPVAAGAPVPAR